MDSFITIAAESYGIYKDKGSKFMAFAFPVSSEEEVKEKVELLRRKYFDARHHCYAYRLGAGGERYRAHDDGEPANSAGKPIFGQLTARSLTNVLVVVVRYFGGILLGTGGLVQAYKRAAAAALDNAEIVNSTITDTCQITFNYEDMNRVLKALKDMNLVYYNLNSEAICTLNVQLGKTQVGQLKKRLEPVSGFVIHSSSMNIV